MRVLSRPVLRAAVLVGAAVAALDALAALDDPVPLDVPAAPGSREPTLTLGDDGTAYLSWLEPAANGRAALRFARRSDGEWSAPATVAEGSNWFISWADAPGLVAFGERALAAWWLEVNGDGPYSYDLKLALSADGGASWSDPFTVHRDGTPTQHGMPSFLRWPDGRLFVTWLDGRINAQGADGASGASLPTGDMTLRSALVDEDGRLSEETELDAQVCTCCPTAAVRAGGAVVVAYRDRSEREVRDIAVRRHDGTGWNEAAPLHRDGWEIAGCPINGAALASDGEQVVAAWFTAAEDRPNLLLAFSSDGGRTFGDPIDIDDGRPVGRTDVVLLADGTALVSWLESTAFGEELRYRRVLVDGSLEPSRTLARSATGRTMGFPRLLRQNDVVLVAWTASGPPLGVRTAIVGLNEGP